MNNSRKNSTPYAAFCRPKLSDLLETLGLGAVYEKARGQYLYMKDANGDDAKVLDLVGGFGAGLLGHNNVELKELIKSALDKDTPSLAQSSERREAGLLAEKINRALPSQKKYLCHFTNSGAEAVEAVLKHAYKVRFDSLRRLFDRVANDIEAFFQRTDSEQPDIEIPGEERDLGKFRDDLDEHNLAQFESFQNNPVVLALKGSFHGKTATALKVTFNRTYREGFEGLSAVRSVFIDFADIGRLSEIRQEREIRFLVPKILDGKIVLEEVRATTIFALCIEVVQGEGGMRPVPDEVLEELALAHVTEGIPLLVDEIQTGCGRTGSFVAYGDTPLRNIDPEYITLSKALGGGLMKAGAALIRHDVYDHDFGILHTSTFAEDELGCIVAGRVVDMLTRENNHLMKEVAAKGDYFLAGLERLKSKHPNVIRDVRGRGLMIGVELAEMEDKSPLFRFGIRQGFLSLLIASYLLFHHRIRMLAPLTTLLKGNPGKKRISVLRIQPAADISLEDIDRTLDALDEVCGVIASNNEGVLMGHLVDVDASREEREKPQRCQVLSPPSDKRVEFDARIGFIVHPPRIEPVLRYYFPTLEGRVRRRKLAEWWSRLGRFLEPDVIHTSYIKSDGFVVEANFVSVPYLARDLHLLYAKARIPNTDRRDTLRLQEVRDKIQDAVTTAKDLGDDCIPTSVVGLGAYTSIVTDRGKTVNDYEIPITTGNAYTAGLMIQGILRAAELKRIELSQSTAAVVGGAGNIGSVLASLLSAHVQKLKLIGRDSGEDSLQRLRVSRLRCLLYLARKAREQVCAGARLEDVRVGGVGDRILQEIVLPALIESGDTGGWRHVRDWVHGKVRYSPDLAGFLEAAVDQHGGMENNDFITLHLSVKAASDCDVVTVATNSPEGRLITPELVKPGAVVSCASVPSNLSAAFHDHMQDYLVFDGGYARLPDGNEINCVGLPENGLAFGCLCETILLGFDGQNCSFARGAIKPEQVDRTLVLAGLYGFQLGDFKLNETPYPAELVAAGGDGRNG